MAKMNEVSSERPRPKQELKPMDPMDKSLRGVVGSSAFADALETISKAFGGRSLSISVMPNVKEGAEKLASDSEKPAPAAPPLGFAREMIRTQAPQGIRSETPVDTSKRCAIDRPAGEISDQIAMSGDAVESLLAEVVSLAADLAPVTAPAEARPEEKVADVMIVELAERVRSVRRRINLAREQIIDIRARLRI